MKIDTRKLARFATRAEDLTSVRNGAQKNLAEQMARTKNMREAFNDAAGANRYRDHVASLSVEQLRKLSPTERESFRVSHDAVLDLVDAIARCDELRLRFAEADRRSSRFAQFVRGLQDFAATHEVSK